VTLAALRRELRALGTPERAAVSAGYFKTGPGQYGEGDRFIGITIPQLRQLVREHAALPLRDVVKLLASSWHEERLAGVLILVRRYEKGDEDERQAIYDLYLQNTSRINNWDLVDASAPHIVGAHLRDRDRAPLYELARSASLWERRIAIIATQHFIRRGDFRDALAIAKLLLRDEHDLIHKAAGWMLREIGDRDRAAEEQFLEAHAARMPRTMLRYAIEKFPVPLRHRYLQMKEAPDERSHGRRPRQGPTRS
jgi:3-methyladenine DNA glycosylase AlkD